MIFVGDTPRNTLVARELGIEGVGITSAADLATALRRYGLLPTLRYRHRTGVIVQRVCWIGMVVRAAGGKACQERVRPSGTETVTCRTLGSSVTADPRALHHPRRA